MHISFTWAGARKKTSFWTGKVGNMQAAPPPSTLPDADPDPDPTPTTPSGDPAAAAQPAPAAWLPAGPALDRRDRHRARRQRGRADHRCRSPPASAYLVEVSGTYRCGSRPTSSPTPSARAAPGDPTWRRDRSVHPWQPGEDHLDLYVDGQSTSWADAETRTPTGCDTRTHTYRDTFTPIAHRPGHPRDVGPDDAGRQRRRPAVTGHRR